MFCLCLQEHVCRELRGPDGDDSELADIYMELSRTYEAIGELQPALDMCTRAIRIYAREHGPHNLPAARAALVAARLQHGCGRGTAALEHLQRACCSTATAGGTWQT